MTPERIDDESLEILIDMRQRTIEEHKGAGNTGLARVHELMLLALVELQKRRHDEKAFNGIVTAQTAEALKLSGEDLKSLQGRVEAQIRQTDSDSMTFFSYGSEHCFEHHKTAQEAIAAAEAAIDDYRGDACDGWSEETDSICWGVIMQSSTKVGVRPRDADDKCDPSIETICDYALLPNLEG